jgi:2-amino-4-hydroxy-6-hydroxymethyldihydropteridine diphosphokinase
MDLTIPSAWAYVALGSNLGNSKRIIQEAIQQLGDISVKPIFVSSLWQTEPVDCPPGSAPFINAMAAILPPEAETPESLLLKLKQLERKFGRQEKKILNEPRPLDLDLISFRQERRDSSELTLPHPRANQRKFVLAPLAEIAPDFILPGQTKTVKELLESLPSEDFVQKLA